MSIRVLYIEDNKAEQTIMKSHFLNFSEYTFCVASSLREGLHHLAIDKFDIVLTDYFLENETSIEIIEAAKTKVPVILITGSGNEAVAVRSMKLGASDYLVKENTLQFFDQVLHSIENSIRLFTAEQKLKETQTRFQNLFENTSDMIQSSFTNGKIEFVNPSWLEALQYNQADLGQLSIANIVHVDHHEYFVELLNQFEQGLSAARAEMKWNTKNGNIIFVECNLHRVLENDIVKVRGVIRNVTDRKRSEQKLNDLNERLIRSNKELKNMTKNLHSLVEQKSGELQSYQEAIDMNICSAIIDNSGNILNVNNTFKSVLNLEQEEITGKSLGVLSDMELYNESGVAKALAINSAWRGELRFLTKNNVQVWVDLAIIPILKEEQPTGKLLALALPITERKESEERQVRVLRLLEDIAFRTSHKVRGPLARIQGVVSLLENKHINMEEFKSVSLMIKGSALELDLATRDLVGFVDANYNSMNGSITHIST